MVTETRAEQRSPARSVAVALAGTLLIASTYGMARFGVGLFAPRLVAERPELAPVVGLGGRGPVRVVLAGRGSRGPGLGPPAPRRRPGRGDHRRTGLRRGRDDRVPGVVRRPRLRRRHGRGSRLARPGAPRRRRHPTPRGRDRPVARQHRDGGRGRRRRRARPRGPVHRRRLVDHGGAQRPRRRRRAPARAGSRRGRRAQDRIGQRDVVRLASPRDAGGRGGGRRCRLGAPVVLRPAHRDRVGAGRRRQRRVPVDRARDWADSWAR